jgi:hypothetical protein
MNFLIKSKSGKCGSIFEVLQHDKEKVMLNYRNNNSTPQPNGPSGTESLSQKPLLTWKLANLNLRQNFYKESDVFTTNLESPN